MNSTWNSVVSLSFYAVNLDLEHKRQKKKEEKNNQCIYDTN